MRNLIFILLILGACESPNISITSESLKGEWLGGHFSLDQDFEVPFSQFIQVNDSSQIRYMSGPFRDTFQDFRLTPDSLILPYSAYMLSHVKLKQENLILGSITPSHFKKVYVSKIDLDSVDIKSILKQGQWESRFEILDFDNEKLTEYNKSSKKILETCWDVYDQNGIKFLQRQGSFASCESPVYALGLIHRISADSMVMERWDNGSFKTLTYKKRDKREITEVEQSFRLCNPYIYENNWGDWYFFKYTGFDGGLYELHKIFKEKFQPPKKGSIDGLVRVQFIINCVGEIGHLEATEMDFQYGDTRLNPAITKQILEILRNAGNWLPGERRGVKLDTYKYLIFRIKEGKIDEIYP